MMNTAVSPDVFTHFDGLADLRRQARADDPDAARQVAKQFEGLFMHMMLKSMRQASFGDPLFGSKQADFYRDMFDQQLAVHLGQTGSLGIADMLERQLSAANGLRPDSLVRPPAPQASAEALLERAGAAQDRPLPELPQPLSDAAAAGPAPFTEPRAFVERLLPQAREAAAELGVDPGVLLAQAALETGWGRHVIRNLDGTSTHNLFNIKADGRWDGPSATVDTLEFQDGVFGRERAAFRSYGSFAESFADYVSLVQDSPRYRNALEAAARPEGYIRALHEAGYATDPDYADKVLRIWRQDVAAVTGEEARHG